MEAITFKVPVGVSNRHIHLTETALEKLFGKGYKLTKLKELLPGQYAAAETVTLVGSRGIIENVRILGPLRNETQVEISRTDSFKLGIKATVKDSGDLDGSAGCALVGPKGIIQIEQGVIIAARHIHMPPNFAKRFGLKDRDIINVEIDDERGLIYKNVLIRVHSSFRLEMHIDTDEANAAFINTGDKVKAVIDDNQSIEYMVG